MNLSLMKTTNKTIAVGISGGVDSAVSAYLLKEKGYKIIGIFLKLFENSDPSDAINVCKALDIDFYQIDLVESFNKTIIEYFKEEYKKARTPNPCVKCNKHIKFGVFLNKAIELGADMLATGHYCSVEKINNRYLIKKSKNALKDQSYMMYSLSQKVLERLVFPLSKFESKEEVKEISKKIGIGLEKKKESQDICFIPNNDYVNFLEKSSDFKRGRFIDEKGNILGEHMGIHRYTIGQRKGLGLSGGPYFVNRIDYFTNDVYVGKENLIFKKELMAEDINFIYEDLKVGDKRRLSAKVRYQKKEDICEIEVLENKRMKVVFDEVVRAITPGQSLVLYKENYLYGGGVIL